MRGVIFNLQHFCTDDGPGIRSTVFLKGCPLRCAWCHNPESQESQIEIFFDEIRCCYCGACVTACPHGAQRITNGKRIFLRELCTRCGNCASVCHAKALEACGKEYEAKDVIEEIAPYAPFFQNSGGGLTVSGGEPLFQPAFSLEICRLAQEQGIHVCVETSGFGKTAHLLQLSKFVDLFLFDFKLKGEKAKAHLGVSDAIILQNLRALNETDAKIVLRCPIIPDVNNTDSHFENIAQTVETVANIIKIELLPYHPLGLEKNKKIGKTPSYKNPNFLDKSALTERAQYLQKRTKIPTVVP